MAYKLKLKIGAFKVVKGINSVNEIPGFDIAKGYAMDVLHTVELGVVKQLTNTWLDSKNHCKPFYLPPSSQKKMNSMLTGVSLPESFSRRARSLDDRQNFKASEWRNFLLFFLPVILNGILPKKFYDHFCLLSNSVYIFYESNISNEALLKIKLDLEEFVIQMSLLYGQEACTYNVHQLLHFCECVSNWGSIYCYSM